MKVVASLYSGAATKFLAALLGAGAESMATGHFDYRTFIAGAATAVAVYMFPNQGTPKAP